MGLKLLHSADWHLDSPFAGFPEPQRTYLKQAQRKIPGQITDLCLREDCDLMLLAGDILDGKAGRETLEDLKRELARSGVPVLIAPGNHDFCAAGSPWLTEDWPENVFIFTGGLESVSISGLDCRIYGAGFRSMDCPPLLEGFRAEGPETYHIGVFHGDPLCQDSPCNPITAAQVRGSGLRYLALGHIHKLGAFRVGQTLCAWPGNPMGRGWDETGKKGVCVVTLEDTAQIQAHSLDTPRFFDLNVDVTEGAAQALEAVLPAGGSEHFYRVTMTGAGPVDSAGLKGRFAGFPNLELLDRTEAPVDLWSSADEDTLEGIFFRMLQEKMEADPENREIYSHAAELTRRLLDGREVTL